MGFPKPRLKFWDSNFIFNRCVNFKLCVQTGEGVVYGWYLYPGYVDWDYIMVLENIVVPCVVRSAFPFYAVDEYVFFSLEFER